MSVYLSFRCHREVKRTEDLLITRNEILVKVFRFDGRPYSDCTVSSSSYFFPIFCPGDFSEILEIFRVDVKVNEVDRFLLSSKNSLPVGKYGRFSFFKMRSCP